MVSEEWMEYKLWLKLTKKNREMTTCRQPVGLGNTRIIANYGEESPRIQ